MILTFSISATRNFLWYCLKIKFLASFILKSLFSNLQEIAKLEIAVLYLKN